ncbi:hypothetical protein D3C87_1860840 [compost metagenome]
MTTSKLVTYRDLAKLSNEDLNLHENTSLKFVAVFTAKDLNTNYFTTTSIIHTL